MTGLTRKQKKWVDEQPNDPLYKKYYGNKTL